MSKLSARFTHLFLALAGVALYQGCDSAVEKEVALAQLAESCLINTDCAAPLVCAFELCHAECESSRDCDSGARCVGAARPYKVCQLEDERACTRTVDCPEGLVCGVDGECRDSCQADSDCVEAQVCVSGTCADKDELDDAGQLTPAPGMSSGSEGAPCVYVSDCSGALLCRGQACLPECRADRDCDAHQVCHDTRCVDDGSQPPACSYNSDCKTSGERCLSGICRCSCVENRDCPADQVCDKCGCVMDPSKKGDCTYNSDCAVPGQICTSGACACQCKQNQDCGDGQICDGCGCVVKPIPSPDGVVLGDVTITSSLQLAQYRGVKSFAGDFTINAPGLLELGDTFDELEGIAGVFQLQGSNVVTRLSFPKLKSVGHAFIVQAAPALLELDLPALETALVVNVVSSPHLTSLVLTNYRTGSIDVASGGVSELSLPAFQHAGTLSLHDGPNLKKLSAPALLDVQNNIYLANLPQLTTVETPLLAGLGTGDGTGSLTLQTTGVSSLAGLLDKVVATLDMPTPHKLQGLMLANNCALTDGGAYAQYFVNVQNTNGACK